MWIDGKLKGIGAFGAEMASTNRAIRIALNIDELTALGEDELAATDGAVRTDALGDSGAAQPRSLVQRL